MVVVVSAAHLQVVDDALHAVGGGGGIALLAAGGAVERGRRAATAEASLVEAGFAEGMAAPRQRVWILKNVVANGAHEVLVHLRQEEVLRISHGEAVWNLEEGQRTERRVVVSSLARWWCFTPQKQPPTHSTPCKAVPATRYQVPLYGNRGNRNGTVLCVVWREVIEFSRHTLASCLVPP